MSTAAATASATPEPSQLLQRIMCAARDAKEAPRPEAIDEFAAEFDRLDKELIAAKKTASDAAKPVNALESELIELVRRFGGPHGKSSKLVHGIAWEMMGTFGKSTIMDNAAIERLRLALKKAGKTKLLKKLFTRDTRWTFSSQALEIVKTEKLTPKQMGMLLQCFDSRDCAPKLDVRPKKKGV
jgi:hypothetical protein